MSFPKLFHLLHETAIVWALGHSALYHYFKFLLMYSLYLHSVSQAIFLKRLFLLHNVRPLLCKIILLALSQYHCLCGILTDHLPLQFTPSRLLSGPCLPPLLPSKFFLNYLLHWMLLYCSVVLDNQSYCVSNSSVIYFGKYIFLNTLLFHDRTLPQQNQHLTFISPQKGNRHIHNVSLTGHLKTDKQWQRDVIMENVKRKSYCFTLILCQAACYGSDF